MWASRAHGPPPGLIRLDPSTDQEVSRSEPADERQDNSGPRQLPGGTKTCRQRAPMPNEIIRFGLNCRLLFLRDPRPCARKGSLTIQERTPNADESSSR